MRFNIWKDCPKVPITELLSFIVDNRGKTVPTADDGWKLIATNCKLRELTDDDIKKISDTYEAFADGTLEDVKGFCAVADTSEIEKQDYILTPGRYVGIEEQEEDDEPFEEKMDRLTSELSEMFVKSHELEGEIRKKLGAIGYEI